MLLIEMNYGFFIVRDFSNKAIDASHPYMVYIAELGYYDLFKTEEEAKNHIQRFINDFKKN